MEVYGLKVAIVDLMKEDEEILYNTDELVEAFKKTKYLKEKDYVKQYKAIDNALRNARKEGLILRHIDKDSERKIQFAVKIAKDKIDVFVAKVGTSKKKYKSLSAKEVRSMFAMQFNNLSKLEDVCMEIIENSELATKELEKIKNFLNKK